MWYAVMNHTDEIIAEAAEHSACSAAALATGRWVDFDSPKGSVAPYRLQTFKPGARGYFHMTHDLNSGQMHGRVERNQ